MSDVMHFLYVEDDETSRMVMEVLLPYWPHESELVLFEDSTNFMDKLLSLSPQPDIIFLDIHMKPHSGFEMLEMIRSHQNYKEQKVIALTASVMNEEIDKLRVGGFDGAVAKPLNRDVFPGLLTRICNGEMVWYVN
jgi:CheY-like chemotaxis protein